MPEPHINAPAPAPLPEEQANASQENSLEQEAHQLATSHLAASPSAKRAGADLLERLPELAALMHDAYHYFAHASDEELALSYAAEWLLDNFYLIQQAIRLIQEGLPKSYYDELPKLDVTNHWLAGYPRIYDIALRAILPPVAYDRCQVDLSQVRRFVIAYQEVAPLTMGELWALPLMLRLALLENLAQAVTNITGLRLGQPAEAVGTGGPRSGPQPPLPDYAIKDWEVVSDVTIANCVPSLRRLSTQDWKSYIEELSLIDRTLRQDPAIIYARMDFDTRDRYRKRIETLALGSGQSEIAVAQKAVELAKSNLAIDGFKQGQHSEWSNLHLPLNTHVGYYLLGQGQMQLEERIGYRPTELERLRRWIFAHPTLLYLGGIALLTLLLLWLFTSNAVVAGAAASSGSGADGWQKVAMALLLFIPVVSLAVTLVNWLITNTIRPKTLPKLDFEAGLPAECRTAVVIPAMLTTPGEVESLLKQMELHYLRNPDPQLCFALLTDFGDAAAETMPEDDALLAQVRAGVEALNQRYNEAAFLLLHRRRQWNPREQVWMGWERKRGKLHEFNRLLRGDTATSYEVRSGPIEALRHIRYVITLDADTILPPNSAQKLVGALAHPLNQARFDTRTGRVISGYTILQPRTEVMPSSAHRSLFTRVFAGDTGLDLYTRAVSDVYQDLFGEGIYVGKGIYDVDAFERSLSGRVPENTLLSHDLFEGIQGRVGLVTDVVLYEDYPSHYLVNVRRSHRWVRGDWQLLPWLAPRVPTVAGRAANALRLIDRWKIADNLRRSLLPPTLLLLFASGWTWLPGSPLLWTVIGLLLSAAPVITAILDVFLQALNALWLHLLARLRQPQDRLGRRRPSITLRAIRDSTIRWLLFIAFLPYETLLNLDAIAVTLLRLVTRRHLLQWTTSAHTTRILGREVGAEVTHRQMVWSLVLVLTMGLLLYFINPAAFNAAVPLLLLWLLAPEIAHWISRPVAGYGEAPLTEGQRRQLRLLALRTWLFFEHFVGPDDNWLPPDHFQESPLGVVAHRTSPTNVGLYLAAMVAARALGYISAMDLALRLRSTFASLERLERYRGHFLNWIDTANLAPLTPRYVSTVDSGNLAACLLVLKQACQAMPDEPAWRWQRWQGLLDTLALLQESVFTATGEPPMADEHWASALESLGVVLDDIRQQVLSVRDTPEQWAPLLERLIRESQPELERRLIDLVEAAAALGDVSPGSEHLLSPALRAKGKGKRPAAIGAATVHDWRLIVERIRHTLHYMKRDLDLLLPWLLPMSQPPALFTSAKSAAVLPPAVVQAWESLQQALLFVDSQPSTANCRLAPIPLLKEIAPVCARGQRQLGLLQERLAAGDPSGQIADSTIAAALDWCSQLHAALDTAQTSAKSILIGFQEVAQQANAYIDAMDFGFLFDSRRQLFHIGFNLESSRLDNNYYDLLASEARIASLVAIAKHDVPQSHWLHLGRPLARSEPDSSQVLLSWSGTMFEYLMPPLFMRSYQGTLLHQSARAAVDHQIWVGKKHGLPWGLSESGFYAFDAAQNYQYRAFGAPGLGFKRGLAEDLVIAPYASLLALSIRPQSVVQNLQNLARRGLLGHYGFYEAIDFTQARLPFGQDAAIVRSYMSHHQGMIMLSLANYLQRDRVVRHFHAEPRIQAVELLLQEQIPSQPADDYVQADDRVTAARPAQAAVVINPWEVPVDSPMPLVHYLSNGRFSSLITNAGAGYSLWQQGQATIALTRWRADSTRDHWGCWLYLQDQESGALWSATLQPTLVQPDSYRVRFHGHVADFRRHDHGITLEMTVTVAPNDDVEIRRVSLANESDRSRRLRLTTYGEVVLAPPDADLRHPAFAKLFVESEYLSEQNALLFRSRPRSAEEKPRYLLHMLVMEQIPGPEEGGKPPTRTYESDRARFLGRGGTAQRPAALLNDQSSSGTTGATLDPIMSLGQEIELPPHATTQFAVITLVTLSRRHALELAAHYRRWSNIERAFRQVRLHAERELRRLDFTTTELALTQQLLSLLLYPHPALRAEPPILAANQQGQAGLWSFGISGDHPLLLLRFGDESEAELLLAVLRAHMYWRRRGLKIDLVILNEQESHYSQNLQGFIHRLIHRLNSDSWLNQRGGIFLLRADQMSEEQLILLQTAARVVLDSGRGSLSQQLASLLAQPVPLPPLAATLAEEELVADASSPMPPLLRPDNLLFDNGLGGFSSGETTAEGGEYLIYLQPGETTPAPWINVVANPDFGFLVSESGGGYTWAVNSGENRLTSWRNDPVSDMPAEALYLRDEETAEIWSPTPQPAPAPAPYLIRHGAGYTIFHHHSHHLRQRLRLFIAPDAPVKIIQLRLQNTAARTRRITATLYVEWVLGTHRHLTQQYLVPEFEKELGALLARNPYAMGIPPEFNQRVAFLAASKEPHGLTADRAEFLGRLGTLRRPAALERIGLGGHVAAGIDPCAALQLHLDLEPGASEEVYFLLGQGADRDQALALIREFQNAGRVAAAWQATRDTWEEILGAVTVKTPDPALDLLLNRWLLYQALACRLWGRSALYQSSGAYGFRDQLQDVTALIHARPELAREHILRAAGHQFEAGDVLHWWHPPSGRGVRTRISDDLVWLPYVTAYYINATGDDTILDEPVPFLKGKPLAEGEEERYGHYETTSQLYPLYEHCRRALEKATTEGRHGLPLIGGGDWNDGMNRVGIEGRGESIWLGWFLYDTLTSFARLGERHGRGEDADRWRQQAEAYRLALETNGWDGQWYRRAYYDDGTPLGSSLNQECRIDSIAQSWAVLSGGAGRQRAQRAMQSVLEHLVKWDEGLILLLTPPLDETAKDPGYIKGYVPGIRENGGQYTHAALWVIWALAQQGASDLAGALYRLINPIYRADAPEKVARYKVEPYVIAADVYGVAPHTGRGGWTWYTGSSGWMYRLGVEAILGLQRTPGGLRFEPRIPRTWPGYALTYRYGDATYKIRVENPDGVERGIREVRLDGQRQDSAEIPLKADGRVHHVHIILGSE